MGDGCMVHGLTNVDGSQGSFRRWCKVKGVQFLHG